MLFRSTGHFRFLTIVPVPYSGRPPHIHVKVKDDGEERLTTQLYLQGQRGHSGLKMRLEPRDLDGRAAFSAQYDLII